MVSILYFTFLKHFLFIWRRISDSTMPGRGRSSPQCTPCPSPLLGTQSHLLDHLGCSAQLCPFPLGNKLPTSEVSSAPDMLSHHTPSTTCAWVGSICLILGFSPLSADINHILHLSYTQCFVTDGILASICLFDSFLFFFLIIYVGNTSNPPYLLYIIYQIILL